MLLNWLSQSPGIVLGIIRWPGTINCISRFLWVHWVARQDLQRHACKDQLNPTLLPLRPLLQWYTPTQECAEYITVVRRQWWYCWKPQAYLPKVAYARALFEEPYSKSLIRRAVFEEPYSKSRIRRSCEAFDKGTCENKLLLQTRLYSLESERRKVVSNRRGRRTLDLCWEPALYPILSTSRESRINVEKDIHGRKRLETLLDDPSIRYSKFGGRWQIW